MKPHYLSLDPEGYKTLMSELEEPSWRGTQIAGWVYQKGVTSPDMMSNVSKKLRIKLKGALDWDLPEIVECLEARDGTTKILLKNKKGQMIESVLMRYEGRTSLCVSSQVGCKLACSFCQTGKLGFFSHLSVGEILGQLALANKLLKEQGSARQVTHIVFMGMGEPLDNYQNVVSAANRMIHADCYGLSARHVTISTSGLAPKIMRLMQDSRASLAISLHAARDDLRTELMPINRKYSLKTLKESLLFWQEATNRKITFEYIMISNKNCGIKEAKDLVKFLYGFKAKVNLIPFNAHPGLPYEQPSDEEIRIFQKYLADRSIPAPVRYSKGLEVSGACGQLAAKVSSALHEKPSRLAVKQLSSVNA